MLSVVSWAHVSPVSMVYAKSVKSSREKRDHDLNLQRGHLVYLHPMRRPSIHLLAVLRIPFIWAVDDTQCV